MKMCELCKIRPATIPDRNRMGRQINRICSDCHAARLRGDLTKMAQTIRVFKIGEELEIKGAWFRVKKINPFGIMLKAIKWN